MVTFLLDLWLEGINGEMLLNKLQAFDVAFVDIVDGSDGKCCAEVVDFLGLAGNGAL